MSEGTFLAALSIICGTISFFVASRFIMNVLSLRAARRLPIAAEELQQRLERIEIAVETTAMEIERIAESNRFMIKVLGEGKGRVEGGAPPSPT
jgi:hypothetical protein